VETTRGQNTEHRENDSLEWKKKGHITKKKAQDGGKRQQGDEKERETLYIEGLEST